MTNIITEYGTLHSGYKQIESELIQSVYLYIMLYSNVFFKTYIYIKPAILQV